MGFNFGRNNGPTAATVAAPVAQTAVAPAALTSAAAVGSTPTKAEFDKTVVDLGAIRTQVAALVVDMTNTRTFETALRTSLRNAAIVA
jgi:4-hydroxyphenylpyruvate dioxygenase-like putative hemolysin